MTFDIIPAGTSVFLDANSLVYAFSSDPRFGTPCQRLLKRMENKELQGITSSHVLAEMAHRLMTLEAAANLGRPLTGLANWLKRHQPEVQGLSLFRHAIDDLSAIPISILAVTGPNVSLAADVSKLYGLLTNDALIVVLMQQNGLTCLASNDSDFDQMPGITRYAPR